MGNKTNLVIAEQSRDIARESKRDSSAMKAIAVLTMVFLPGTFFAVRSWRVLGLLPLYTNCPKTLFAMPLFDWEASSSLRVLKSRSWVYWAVTVPATILVHVFWRIWFKFDNWRMVNNRGGRFWDDVVVWLRSDRNKEMDVEDGREDHKRSSLEETASVHGSNNI